MSAEMWCGSSKLKCLKPFLSPSLMAKGWKLIYGFFTLSHSSTSLHFTNDREFFPNVSFALPNTDFFFFIHGVTMPASVTFMPIEKFRKREVTFWV